MTEGIDWLDPWYLVSRPEVCAGLEHQLKIEVGPRHVLYGIEASLVARRDDTDDALFALPDGRVAEVHMTWRGSPEPDPRWPVTAIFPSLEDWAEESMRPLSRELSEFRRPPC